MEINKKPNDLSDDELRFTCDECYKVPEEIIDIDTEQNDLYLCKPCFENLVKQINSFIDN